MHAMYGWDSGQVKRTTHRQPHSSEEQHCILCRLSKERYALCGGEFWLELYVLSWVLCM